mmetsp:Transcript_7617/g.9936  ORF Transcript_7617/g.9936 Transcript_7617/m.9936 type:complete len:107 (+) Transcript_7617:604-924(+)
MSILKACSLVPEILLDAPEEIENQSIKKRFAEAIAVVFLRTLRVGCIVTVRGGKGVLLRKKEDGSWSAPLALMYVVFVEMPCKRLNQNETKVWRPRAGRKHRPRGC